MTRPHVRVGALLLAIFGVGAVAFGFNWVTAAARSFSHPVPLVADWGLFGVVFVGGLGLLVGFTGFVIGVLLAVYGLPNRGTQRRRQTPPL